jgi:3-hydroxybutyrate dehydrogenase
LLNVTAKENTMNNKSAIVTGSTSGIGLAIARHLAKAGCHIMLNGFGERQVIDSL